jgi:ABC-type branched-subunit amino acid transport system ATPase component
LLELRDLTAGYGGGAVLRGVDLTVATGDIACIVGPNGAGKSTVFRAVSGLLNIMGGSILLDGERIDHLSSADITKAGIAQVPQSNGLFPTLTVKENVLMGGYLIRRKRALVKERYDHVASMYPVVRERSRDKAGNLSGGQRRMVEFARALMLDPRLVLLDEPSVGLDPIILAQVKEAILTMNQDGHRHGERPGVDAGAGPGTARQPGDGPVVLRRCGGAFRDGRPGRRTHRCMLGVPYPTK